MPVHMRDINGDPRRDFFGDFDGDKNSHVWTAGNFSAILQILVNAIS